MKLWLWAIAMIALSALSHSPPAVASAGGEVNLAPSVQIDFAVLPSYIDSNVSPESALVKLPNGNGGDESVNRVANILMNGPGVVTARTAPTMLVQDIIWAAPPNEGDETQMDVSPRCDDLRCLVALQIDVMGRDDLRVKDSVVDVIPKAQS